MSSQALCLEVGVSRIAFKVKNEIALKIFNDQTVLGKSFFDIVSTYVPCGIVIPENIKSAVENRFKSLCGKVDCQYRKMKGRGKEAFLKKERSLTIDFDKESPLIQDPRNVIKDIIIQALEEEIKRMECVAHESLSELRNSIHNFEKRCLELEKDNRYLVSQIKECHMLENYGKKVGEGSRSTDKRKLHAVGSVVVQALEEILDSYGLTICQLVVGCRYWRATA